jgi:hypothetical protein
MFVAEIADASTGSAMQGCHAGTDGGALCKIPKSVIKKKLTETRMMRASLRTPLYCFPAQGLPTV